MMKKRNAVIYLIVLVLIMCGLGYMAVFGVGADKSGAASSIDLGLDLAGGVSITYQVVGEEEPSKEDMEAVRKRYPDIEGAVDLMIGGDFTLAQSKYNGKGK